MVSLWKSSTNEAINHKVPSIGYISVMKNFENIISKKTFHCRFVRWNETFCKIIWWRESETWFNLFYFRDSWYIEQLTVLWLSSIFFVVCQPIQSSQKNLEIEFVHVEAKVWLSCHYDCIYYYVTWILHHLIQSGSLKWHLIQAANFASQICVSILWFSYLVF